MPNSSGQRSLLSSSIPDDAPGSFCVGISRVVKSSVGCALGRKTLLRKMEKLYRQETCCPEGNGSGREEGVFSMGGLQVGRGLGIVVDLEDT